MKEAKSKVNISKSGNGYLIEITNTPIDQTYAVTKDELERIVLYGQAILKEENCACDRSEKEKLVNYKDKKSNN